MYHSRRDVQHQIHNHVTINNPESVTIGHRMVVDKGQKMGLRYVNGNFVCKIGAPSSGLC